MRRVSRRPEGENPLADAAILQRTMSRLRGGALIPRGVYRFRDHEEADEHDPDDRGYSRAPELEDLVSLCKALNDEGVRYVLIGGFAVILHGFVRATKDIDLLVDASAENVKRLKRAMATVPDKAIDLIADDEVERYTVVRIADEIVIDLMKSACGISYEEAAPHIETRNVEGVAIHIADKETSRHPVVLAFC